VLALDDSLLISASTGPSTRKGRLYKTMLWEGPLEPVTTGLPEWFEGNLNSHCLAHHDGSVFAGFDTTVWRSDDGGNSWIEAATGLPRITCLA
jgi:hypothetical protein